MIWMVELLLSALIAHKLDYVNNDSLNLYNHTVDDKG